jgi:hypothetical protein
MKLIYIDVVKDLGDSMEYDDLSSRDGDHEVEDSEMQNERLADSVDFSPTPELSNYEAELEGEFDLSLFLTLNCRPIQSITLFRIHNHN